MLLQQLVYFSKVAEYQNVTRASEVLFVSQPTLSRTIRQLEEELGCALFERKGKSLTLTESGQLLLDRSNEIISLLQRTQNDLQDLNLAETPRITIQLRCIAGLFYDIIPGFIREHPEIELEILQNDNIGIDHNHFDLFLYPADAPLNEPDAFNLLREKIYIGMAKDHPLAGIEKLQRKDLASYPFIDVAKNRYFKKISEQLWDKNLSRKELLIHSDDIGAIRRMVVRHGYLAEIPEFTLTPEEQSGMVLRQLEDVEMHRYIILSDNTARPVSRYAALFKDYLISSLVRRGILTQN